MPLFVSHQQQLTLAGKPLKHTMFNLKARSLCPHRLHSTQKNAMVQKTFQIELRHEEELENLLYCLSALRFVESVEEVTLPTHPNEPSMPQQKILLPNGAEVTSWTESALQIAYKLERINTPTPLMQEWLNVAPVELEGYALKLFEQSLQNAKDNIEAWNEETFKMLFIAQVFQLAELNTAPSGTTIILEALLKEKVGNYELAVKPDYMLASGQGNVFAQPYFHFQEYKPDNPTGDAMAQLLMAMLIAQKRNALDLPMYALKVVGAKWQFVIFQGNSYCVSKRFDCTEREELLLIIAILRNFKLILTDKLLPKTNSTSS